MRPGRLSKSHVNVAKHEICCSNFNSLLFFILASLRAACADISWSIQNTTGAIVFCRFTSCHLHDQERRIRVENIIERGFSVILIRIPERIKNLVQEFITAQVAGTAPSLGKCQSGYFLRQADAQPGTTGISLQGFSVPAAPHRTTNARINRRAFGFFDRPASVVRDAEAQGTLWCSPYS